MPAPSGLSYGLNVPKKTSLTSRLAQQPKRKTIFDDDSAPEDAGGTGNGAEAIDTFDDAAAAPLTRPKAAQADSTASTGKKAPLSHHVDLSSHHSASKAAATAQELDPSVYNYDEVYDSLHAKPSKAKGPTGSRYMANLLAAAEVRKRDQLRAKEKMLAKEREAEGDEFAEKEKFVTGAYKAQQEENRRLEEEEREKEKKEAERKRRMGGGMSGLYKGLLEREEARHEAAIKAVEEGVEQGEEEHELKGKSDAELAKEKGATVNEEGQVVDKRELLQAGLNIKAKPKPSATKADGSRTVASSEGTSTFSGRNASRAAMRARQSQMLEEQLAEAAKRAAHDEEVEQEAMLRAAKSKKTEGEVSSARERYLQRKKEAEAAKAAGTEP